jgi:flagellar biosynthesis chaperone FliJ
MYVSAEELEQAHREIAHLKDQRDKYTRKLSATMTVVGKTKAQLNRALDILKNCIDDANLLQKLIHYVMKGEHAEEKEDT